jgi:sulfur carrier protein ThiS
VLPTLLQLLQELGVEGRRVAVECNGDIVPRSQYGHVMLNSGDCLEIVVAVGGG